MPKPNGNPLRLCGKQSLLQGTQSCAKQRPDLYSAQEHLGTAGCRNFRQVPHVKQQKSPWHCEGFGCRQGIASGAKLHENSPHAGVLVDEHLAAA